MSTYDPFVAARRMAAPPAHVVYTAHSLDGYGYFARCDGCGWCGELTTAAGAWAAANDHMADDGRASA